MPTLTSADALTLIRDQYGLDLTEAYAVDVEHAEATGDQLGALRARGAAACVEIARQLLAATYAAHVVVTALHRDMGQMVEVLGLPGMVAGVAVADDDDGPAVDVQPITRLAEHVAAAGALDRALRTTLELFPPYPAPAPPPA